MTPHFLTIGERAGTEVCTSIKLPSTFKTELKMTCSLKLQLDLNNLAPREANNAVPQRATWWEPSLSEFRPTKPFLCFI